MQLAELKDDQVSIIRRNKWLEENRVEMSRRLAGSQDAQAVLRAAADKALAFAAAASEEAAAADDAQQRERGSLLGLLAEVRSAVGCSIDAYCSRGQQKQVGTLAGQSGAPCYTSSRCVPTLLWLLGA